MANPEGDIEYTDTEPHGWIQWKDTDVCINLYCPCGKGGQPYHHDGYSFYDWECHGCGQAYKVGANVKLIPVTKEKE